MARITLARTNDRPLQFDGKLLAEACTKATSGPGQNRWWDLKLYGTDDGSYVCAAGYRTTWQGEQEYDELTTTSDPDAVANWFQGIQLALRVFGYPKGPQYRDRQNRLMKQLQSELDTGVTEILSILPPEKL